MSQRATMLADQFEEQIQQLVETIEKCSEQQWKANCGEEQWSVAATAHHVGAQFGLEMEYLTACADGRILPQYSWDDINRLNDDRAAANTACDKAAAIRQLREGSAPVAAWVRGLTDQQLDRTGALPLAGGAQVSTQQLIEGGVLIDHARAHLASIRAVP